VLLREGCAEKKEERGERRQVGAVFDRRERQKRRGVCEMDVVQCGERRVLPRGLWVSALLEREEAKSLRNKERPAAATPTRPSASFVGDGDGDARRRPGALVVLSLGHCFTKTHKTKTTLTPETHPKESDASAPFDSSAQAYTTPRSPPKTNCGRALLSLPRSKNAIFDSSLVRRSPSVGRLLFWFLNLYRQTRVRLLRALLPSWRPI
jgi:hypothetical protein